MLLGTLGASLLGNLLTGKGMVRAGYGRPLSPASQNNKGKGIVSAGYGNQLKKKKIFNTASSFNKLWNELRFNGVFSRDNLPKKIKDEAYVINLDEHEDTGTHGIALFCSRNEIGLFW